MATSQDEWERRTETLVTDLHDWLMERYTPLYVEDPDEALITALSVLLTEAAHVAASFQVPSAFVLNTFRRALVRAKTGVDDLDEFDMPSSTVKH